MSAYPEIYRVISDTHDLHAHLRKLHLKCLPFSQLNSSYIGYTSIYTASMISLSSCLFLLTSQCSCVQVSCSTQAYIDSSIDLQIVMEVSTFWSPLHCLHRLLCRYSSVLSSIVHFVALRISMQQF